MASSYLWIYTYPHVKQEPTVVLNGRSVHPELLITAGAWVMGSQLFRSALRARNLRTDCRGSLCTLFLGCSSYFERLMFALGIYLHRENLFYN